MQSSSFLGVDSLNAKVSNSINYNQQNITLFLGGSSDCFFSEINNDWGVIVGCGLIVASIDSMNIRPRLQQATQGLHDKLEIAIPIMSPSVTVSDYICYLSKIYGFVVCVENEIKRYYHYQNITCLETERRSKTSLITQDLWAFGVNLRSIPLCNDIPEVSGFAHCLGCLYVLEGSTLGGQIILRHLQKFIPEELTQGGLKYLEGHGPSTQGMWDQYISFLNQYSEQFPEQNNEIIYAAVQTFEKLAQWLRREN